jgi:hypothetical protein
MAMRFPVWRRGWHNAARAAPVVHLKAALSQDSAAQATPSAVPYRCGGDAATQANRLDRNQCRSAQVICR